MPSSPNDDAIKLVSETGVNLSGECWTSKQEAVGSAARSDWRPTGDGDSDNINITEVFTVKCEDLSWGS